MNPTLFITLGTSPAIVPEAFFLPGVRFSAVHVLTSEKTSTSLVWDFFERHHPDAHLTVSRVADFTDLRNETSHFRFEEVLYRWILAAGVPADSRYVCLSGGFKTMSAATQKAAAVLGAAEVFHVLADSCCPSPDGRLLPPSTIEEILRAMDHGQIHYVRLGPETGWPQFHHLTGSDFPLLSESAPDSREVRLSSPDSRFSERLKEVVTRSHHIARAWNEIGNLPFPALATWSAEKLAWIKEAIDPDSPSDRDWLASLPKIDLHCHLGGFATTGPLLEEVRAAARNPQALPPLEDLPTPDNWPLPAAPIGLENYMRLGNNNGSALLKDPGCLRRHCELLYAHLVEQKIAYAEIRCSPANYSTPERSPWQVLTEIKQTFDRCRANVAAGVPPGRTVQPSVPLGGSETTCGTHAPPVVPGGMPPPTDRLFIPYDKQQDFTQTWRNLPHRHQPGATAFISFRLSDSLPKSRLQVWHQEHQRFLNQNPKPWSNAVFQEYRRRFPEQLELWLDEAHGECLLRREEIASIVENALRYFDGSRYVLDAFVIMPNHVHLLVKPLGDWRLSTILHSWKSYTAKAVNRALGRSGSVWQPESFDHLVRSADQLDYFRKYIFENPQKAGLTEGFRTGRGIGIEVPVAEGTNVAAGVPPGGTVRPSVPLGASKPTCGTHAPPVVPGKMPAPTVHLILIATRKPSHSGDHRAAISRHLALAVTAAEHWTRPDECRVVGVDLAGWEDISTRAHYYREEFAAVHRCGLSLTVHAGENDNAEGIWRAVFDLNALRLGHALHLSQSPELLRSVITRRVTVEMCPFANYQIKGFQPMKMGEGTDYPPYPLLDYLRLGVRVTINTDNIGISSAGLSENLLFAARLCPGLTRLDILHCLRHAIDGAFLDPRERQRIEKQLTSFLSQS